jgi:DNA polymerase I-like protein with 3'-5' exonuclease and polymerase domains
MSDIKKCFTSRWDTGRIVEIDWNQLEVVILAVESQDIVLTSELNDGIDLHSAMTATVYGKPYNYVKSYVDAGDDDWVGRRKKIKSARFALQYGAGAKKIAETAGWDIGEAKTFQKAYYDRYCGIFIWNQLVKNEVIKTAKPTGNVVEGFAEYRGQYISPNGRRYVFTGRQNKWGGISFPPTKLQNYPIQGLASDFVKMMRRVILKELYGYTLKPDILHVNTIHDSIMFDCKTGDDEEFLRKIIKEQYAQASTYLYRLVHRERKVAVPLNYSIKSNHYWS